MHIFDLHVCILPSVLLTMTVAK